MLTICRVALRPWAFASFVGMPMASCGVFTMTLSAPPRHATAGPRQMMAKARDSSSGNPPIHW